MQHANDQTVVRLDCTVLGSKDMTGSRPNLHGPHLNHVPFDMAIAPALVRLSMPVAV